jgi:hypothetical protein
MKINENFLKIESSYLFSTVAKKQRDTKLLILTLMLSAFQ